jgi:hypothetical protein
MNAEVWQEIDGTDGVYEISSHGRVRSYTRSAKGFLMSPRGNNDMFFRVELSVDYVKTNHLIHRLVAQAFVENTDPENKVYVIHLDRNKKNNYYKNLKWVDKKEWVEINRTYSFEKMIQATRKLQAEQIPDIKARYAAGERTVELASEYGVSAMQINRVIRGENWKHITEKK